MRREVSVKAATAGLAEREFGVCVIPGHITMARLFSRLLPSQISSSIASGSGLSGIGAGWNDTEAVIQVLLQLRQRCR